MTSLLSRALVLSVALLGAGDASSKSKRAPSSVPRAEIAGGQQKLLLADEYPPGRSEFEVGPAGRLYFPSGSAYVVYAPNGDFEARLPTEGKAEGLVSLATGQFVNAQSGGAGRLSLLRKDGTELRSLVTRGATEQLLHRDVTGWTTPTHVTVDQQRGWLFALDTTAAHNQQEPEFSRVAVFDMTGKWLRSLLKSDGTSATDASLRTWYDDIEVDPKRGRLLLTARGAQQLRIYDYDGRLLSTVPGVAGIGVFHDGRVAVGNPDRKHVDVYGADFKLARQLECEDERDLEVDVEERLLASLADQTVLIQRFDASLLNFERVSAHYARLEVETVPPRLPSEEPISLSARVAGFPSVPAGELQAWTRAADGSATAWQRLQARYVDGKLVVIPSASLQGAYDLRIRYGRGGLPLGDTKHELSVSMQTLFQRASALPRLALFGRSARSAFEQGEVIKLRLLAAEGGPRADSITLRRLDAPVGAVSLSMPASSYIELAPELTRRLVPGRYQLEPSGSGTEGVAWRFEIAQAEADSPVQRVLYHEFDQHPATSTQPGQDERGGRIAYVASYLEQLKYLGFNRETDRSGLKLLDGAPGRLQAPDVKVEDVTAGYFTPTGGHWEADVYLDRATGLGIAYDTQVLGHCATAPLADESLTTLQGGVKRLAQWFGKYPAFHGFNFNDELFFDNTPFVSMPTNDKAWLDRYLAAHAGSSRPDAYRAALEHLYSALGSAARLAAPGVALTATPMWQYPAVEGSYPPAVYRHLTESYSHYLSEGYDWPFFAPHSVDMLRRPGLPLIGVFDNGFKTGDGEVYLKNAMLVLGRGTQGVGVSHTKPFQDAAAASALRVANQLARSWGPVFGEATPDNEGAILYSYAQDRTEKRHVFGTPHWERVFAAYGGALMAHVPMSIVCEEDVAAGALLERGKPRVSVLFLAGQTERLPKPVLAAIASYRELGGRIVTDSASASLDGAERLDVSLDTPLASADKTLDGDALFSVSQPAYVALADALHNRLASTRRFPIDVDDRWVAVNRFRAGEVRYVLLASETGPYELSPEQVWSLGAYYNRSYQPKVTRLSFPATGAVYDAFEQRRVAARELGASGRQEVDVDLRAFPGRLYALATRPLSAPALSLRVGAERVEYRIDAGIRGGVPVRIRLLAGDGVLLELFRLTRLDGTLQGSLGRPALEGKYRIEVAELLSGQAVSAALVPAPLAPRGLRESPRVELESPRVLAQLLAAPGPVRIVVADGALMASQPVQRLRRWLEARGRQVSIIPQGDPAAGLVVAIAVRGAAGLGSLQRAAQYRGASALASNEPIFGRALVAPALAVRSAQEDLLLVSAGDQDALAEAVQQLVELSASRVSRDDTTDGPTKNVPGVPTAASESWRLSEHVGARLADVRAAAGRVVVSARGLLGNLALIQDDGDRAHVLDVARVGEGPATSSLFLSRDGTAWGAGARTVQQFGEAFYLRRLGSTGSDAFASFGDLGATLHQFGVDADARTIVAPGPHGIIAWRCAVNGDCVESWRDPVYEQFDALDWPVDANAERAPWLEVKLPPRARVALVGYGDLTDNGWIKGEAVSQVSVTARALDDGRVLWRYAPQLNGQLAFPSLYTNDDGSLVLLQLQLGSWRSQSFAYYLIAAGKLQAKWSGTYRAAAAVLSADRVLTASTARELELRDSRGELIYSQVWPAQPLSVALDLATNDAFIADDAGRLTRLDREARRVWQTQLESGASLALTSERLYAAGWDGRLRGFDLNGGLHFSLDLTPVLNTTRSSVQSRLYVPSGRAQTTSSVPRGPSLLTTGQARLTIGGTPGWKSRGSIQIGAELLTNGQRDDCPTPWLAPQELFWDGVAGRQVWAQIDFARPTDVESMTVYEDPQFPRSFPTEAQVEVWSASDKRWKTVKHPVFLAGAVNTYTLDLKQVSRLRYVPWANYFRNFHTSEIEVR